MLYICEDVKLATVYVNKKDIGERERGKEKEEKRMTNAFDR